MPFEPVINDQIIHANGYDSELKPTFTHASAIGHATRRFDLLDPPIPPPFMQVLQELSLRFSMVPTDVFGSKKIVGVISDRDIGRKYVVAIFSLADDDRAVSMKRENARRPALIRKTARWSIRDSRPVSASSLAGPCLIGTDDQRRQKSGQRF
jgi:hypothetical protein